MTVPIAALIATSGFTLKPLFRPLWSLTLSSSEFFACFLKWLDNPTFRPHCDKIQLPKLIWNEYALCVNFDKESKQLEMAIKFIQNAKSLASLKKMVTSSNNSDFLSKAPAVLERPANRVNYDFSSLFSNPYVKHHYLKICWWQQRWSVALRRHGMHKLSVNKLQATYYQD